MRREQEGSIDDARQDNSADLAALEAAVARAVAHVARKKPPLLPLQISREMAQAWARTKPVERRKWLNLCPWAARPEVVRALLSEGRAITGEDPARAGRLASLALELTRSLRTRPFHSLLADLEAEALGLLANSLRVQGRYEDAGQLWDRIGGLRRRGTRDPLLLAHLDHYHCAFLRARRNLERGAALGWRSANTFAALGHPEEAFLVSFTLSSVLYAAGDFEGALTAAVRWSPRAAGSSALLRYRLLLQQNVALFLAELGEFRNARLLLARAEPLYATEGTPTLRLQLSWLKAKILAGQGNFRDAAPAFRALRQDYLARERPFDAALVGLDEMLCLAELRRLSATCEVAREILPTFARLELPTETARAVEALERAAARVRADLEQVRLVHGLLQPIRRLPPRT